MTHTSPPAPVTPRPDFGHRRTIAAIVVAVVLLSALIGLVRGGDTGAATPAVATSSPRSLATLSATSTSPAAGTSPTSTASPTSASPTSVPTSGADTFTTVTVPQTTTATTGRVISYALQIENGIGADNAQVAQTIGADLLDARGWQGVDHVRFVQLTAAQLAAGVKPTAFITLASPKTVDTLCAHRTEGKWSCGHNGRAVLNYERWVLGVPFFNGDLTTYRAYLVNHEVGHLLGHSHQLCGKPGDYAPVMQQQSMGLQGCKPWSWPQRPAST